MSFLKHTLPLFLMLASAHSSVHAAAQPLVCLIQPSSIAEVGSSVTGVIESLRVERGDIVKKGQTIAVLRNDVEQAALNVARSRAQADADVQAAIAGLAFAHQSTVRGEDLIKKKFISEQALDKTRTEERLAVQKLAQAREQRRIWDREMSLAKSQLAQRTIVSPISGIVAERYVSNGERVEDRSIARVVSIHPLHVEVMVPATSFGKIKTGMMATVTPELPDMPPMEARVNLVDKLIDGASNTFRVRLELPNADHAIPAGPRCKVAFGDQVIGASASKGKLTPRPVSLRAAPPTPTQAAAPVARNASAASLELDALNALENWRKAWEEKNVAAYLAAYAGDFRGTSASREAWAKQRDARIRKPGNLEIRISEARVQPMSGDKVNVQFRQSYQGGGFHASTLKSLLMVLEQGKWLILEERVLPK
ncbi:MAG: efflux RND transporter periplasmic adaptor subunit [Thiobacillus sp.]|nr:efflux RND transporter periplasmic adaptor subunit [Thiobacillus sp.]